MKEYADTSFLVSLYAADSNTPAAAAHANSWTAAPLLPVTPFGGFELRNTLRRVLPPSAVNRIARRMKGDFGHTLLARPLEAWRWLEIADQLSAARVSQRMRIRALDVLHVAAAIVQQRPVFLTFDRQQREFARACGLTAPDL